MPFRLRTTVRRMGDVVHCDRCLMATIHERGACTRCAQVRELGALNARSSKGNFDLARALGAVLIVVSFGVVLYEIYANAR